MVKQMKQVQKEVPKTVPVPLGDINDKSIKDAENCGCFQEECACYGKPGCSCCYPSCGCAPSMISPTEMEIIITEEACEVAQDYIETFAREVPAIVQTNYTYKEPTLVKKPVNKRIPRLF